MTQEKIENSSDNSQHADLPHADTRTRIESDSMGSLEIPNWAYWGAQTGRALKNFTASPLKINPYFLHALARIKRAIAAAHSHLNLIDSALTDAIITATDEIIAGVWNKHFPIDVFQTGSGTSWNMNINEVIANRANQLLGGTLGSRSPVHPNDHVNRGQSSNDVIPTAIHIANRVAIAHQLPKIEQLAASLNAKATEYKDTIKLGRTHLQDAVPMTFGDEFSGYAAQIETAVARIAARCAELEEVPLGGTAIGTGLNAHPQVAYLALERISADLSIPFRLAQNRFALMASRDAQVALAGDLNALAVALIKIANDIRLLASGPRAGLAEITLPALQPGSSIMPGKVNPVIPEVIIQIAARICGAHTTVTIAGQHAPLELNMMHPIIAYETLSALELIGNGCHMFAEKCIDGITVNEKRSRELIEDSLALVTPLAIEIGYDMAADIAHEAYTTGKSIRAVAIARAVLPTEKIDHLLDPRAMLGSA